jgi:hypothetical protein
MYKPAIVKIKTKKQNKKQKTSKNKQTKQNKQKHEVVENCHHILLDIYVN